MKNDTLAELISDIRFAMLTTSSPEGELRARPLVTQEVEGDQPEFLYFFVPSHGEVLDDINANHTVNVAYANTGKHRYVSISGEAELIDDQYLKDSLWSPMATVWFPEGSRDPNVALLRVRIVDAHYWNAKTSKVVQLYRMAKALAVGKSPKIGESVEVHVSR